MLLKAFIFITHLTTKILAMIVIILRPLPYLQVMEELLVEVLLPLQEVEVVVVILDREALAEAVLVVQEEMELLVLVVVAMVPMIGVAAMEAAPI